MADQTQDGCLNCGRTEAQTPLTSWRYQGRELRICPQCTPAFIHETEKVLAKRQTTSEPDPTRATPGG
jgi:hypothetical protein